MFLNLTVMMSVPHQPPTSKQRAFFSPAPAVCGTGECKVSRLPKQDDQQQQPQKTEASAGTETRAQKQRSKTEHLQEISCLCIASERSTCASLLDYLSLSKQLLVAPRSSILTFYLLCGSCLGIAPPQRACVPEKDSKRRRFLPQHDAYAESHIQTARKKMFCSKLHSPLPLVPTVHK